MNILDKMEAAVEKVRARLQRASAALQAAGVPYAVVRGNAVAAWVAEVDESAVRNTQDVDILLSRKDLEAARSALEVAGFVYRHVAGIDLFLDGPEARARDAVHLVFAGEKVKSDYPLPSPAVSEAQPLGELQVLSLPALVRMKLTSNRLKDRVHLQDLISVGLVDEAWLENMDEPLRSRLAELLANPEL